LLEIGKKGTSVGDSLRLAPALNALYILYHFIILGYKCVSVSVYV